MANTNLNASMNLVDLDFVSLKNSFKSYLKGQAQFQDYDFEGSNIAVLLELLAKNSYLNAFYLNMMLSEGFIDSAQLRNSLFSHAKELNYLPRSIRSARARIKVDFEATGESQPYIIPKGSQFSTLVKTASYVFTIPETIVCASQNTSFTFTTDIYEGIYKKDAYVFLSDIENQRFKITNKTVDTRAITVTVYEDGNETGDIYTYTTSLLDLNYASKVFFLQPSETGHYEIFFGDNVLGRQPKINSTVVIDYRISKGEAANGARSFSVDFEPTAENEVTTTPIVTVYETAKNGSEEETNESIRYYAPRHFQVQERAVVATDYEISLKTRFPEINAIAVYGGEVMNPPQFGRVFVAVDITNIDGLPDSKRDEYYKFLKMRSPLSIDPVFIEPEYSYLQINSLVRYNLNITTNSLQRVKTLVTDIVKNYNEINLNNFNVTLRHSALEEDIQNADKSIISNITNVRLYKKFEPTLGVKENTTLNFGLKLKLSTPVVFPNKENIEYTVESTNFRYNGDLVCIHDDSSGALYLTKADPNRYDQIVASCGTVDYETGIVSLSNLRVDSYDGSAIKLYVLPRDVDIAASQNNILGMELDEINIDAEALRI